MKLFGKEVIFYFQNPPESDIVIFDESNSHHITEYILDGIPSFIFVMRSEIKLYVSPSIIYNFLKSLCLFYWNREKTSKKFGLLRHYYLSCFQSIKPKVIITVIDNSSFFHWLSKNYKGPHFFSIQNGNRINEQLDKMTKEYHQHFFCFGNYEKDRYKRFGHIIELCHPVGSLKAGYYKFNNRNKESIKKKYDIGIVSPYYNSMLEKGNPDLIKSLSLMYTYLAQFISEYNTKAVIFFHGQGNHNNEIEYFNNFFDNNVEYIYQNYREFSTYRGMDASEVVVAFCSTACIEAFGWGNKLLHCDFTGSNKYNDYDPMIMFTETNYSAFKMRLNELINEPYKEYRERTKEYASYLMNNDPDIPPHIYIRKKIEEYL